MFNWLNKLPQLLVKLSNIILVNLITHLMKLESEVGAFTLLWIK